ncbi:ubiquinol oxidase subunit II [Lichenihabitans psoromatis]|uniref:ubiquinol oxidase subunit II n=1 Tax=Lichenihabitans psoromatis TaxID=2528642 RepID=UPI00103831F9|nr:ubiquinol oxidase subunit II [Lichenihabitans psoromatis]
MVWSPVKLLRILMMLPLFSFLGGCNAVLMSPSGDVAIQQRNLIIISTLLMLLIILPVMVFTALFAWRYRASNAAAVYDPEWHHSTKLEVLIWTAPLMIIIALGALTWISTHLLDPFRPIGRISATIPASDKIKPLTVEVVALDWKWLFLYPDQGVASINELALPVDVPVQFKITSATVMNSFFIPALAGQIYAMAGMQTQLHAVINEPGTYEGFSANYSGAGFSHMHFKMNALSDQDFGAWVEKLKQQGSPLGKTEYVALEKPSEKEPVRYFSSTQPGLYDAILNLCALPGKMCVNEMMQIDAKGGAGKDSEANFERLKYDNHRMENGDEASGATFPASGRPPNSNVQPEGMKPRALSPIVNEKAPATGDQNGSASDMNDMPGMKPESPAPVQLTK